MKRDSVETILTIEHNRTTGSDYSFVWSTTNIRSGMAMATAGAPRRRMRGRRRMRVATLVLGSMLAMHCRVSASSLTGGFFVFLLMLGPAVALLGNPLRHFEIYLGQWAISGPGRAFHIIPMLDGIGLAICINALFRSICCGMLAAISATYVLQGISDEQLPSTFCRNFNLTAYQPDRINILSNELSWLNPSTTSSPSTTIGTEMYAWRNIGRNGTNNPLAEIPLERTMSVCREEYPAKYPAIYKTPAYNYFYVEVMRLRPDYSYGTLNRGLIWNILFVWGIIWVVLLFETMAHGKLVWNVTTQSWALIPWLWSPVLVISSIMGFVEKNRTFRYILKLEAKDFVAGISDALEVSIYIHAASLGTEIIHGKGLNFYATGHIDPKLNSENVWHSVLILLLSALNASGSAICALVDHKHQDLHPFENVVDSTLWILPMYSNCTSYGTHTHFRTILVFTGLMISYLFVACTLLKSALHAIFEYKVRLVFIEQFVVFASIAFCASLSLVFTTNGGLPLLESVESLLSGIAMPFICVMELIAFLFVYRSSDFMSDINVSTEENTCAMRIGMQWLSLPWIIGTAMVLKIIVLSGVEYPSRYMVYGAVPLLIIVLAVPTRAGINIYHFLHPRHT